MDGGSIYIHPKIGPDAILSLIMCAMSHVIFEERLYEKHVGGGFLKICCCLCTFHFIHMVLMAIFIKGNKRIMTIIVFFSLI